MHQYRAFKTACRRFPIPGWCPHPNPISHAHDHQPRTSHAQPCRRNNNTLFKNHSEPLNSLTIDPKPRPVAQRFQPHLTIGKYSPRLTRVFILRLHRRAPYRAERAKDAAIAWLGAEQRFASFALVAELACVRGHRLPFGEAALRAGDNRIGFNRIHLTSLAHVPQIEHGR
jgi:hypothetical protein